MDWDLLFLLLGMTFFYELVDSSLGMGYGTTLTPVLLFMRYEPMQVFPSVLFLLRKLTLQNLL